MNLKRKVLAFAVLIFACLFVKGQNITGKIHDAVTQEGVVGVTVMVKHTNRGIVSGSDGSFSLEAKTGDTLLISCMGYATKTVIAKNNVGKVSLEHNSLALNQIVVTGSRNAQKRTELPLAMATLSAAEIEQARATSTDQLLNKSPGVYMVDLGNEQHSMAMRQPLSYKSLFLYLEDGVPIRTTGLFNHNALLEMNMAAFRNIEVVRGPASSLYGAEAIGGVVNFITLNPTPTLTGKVSLQGNNLGFKRSDFLLSNTYGKLGVLVSGNYAFRKNGYREHSDYEKLALTTKLNYQISDKAVWDNSITYVDYVSDMTGSLDSARFYDKQYSSVQTFTDRDVQALRYRSSLKYFWNQDAKTTATVFLRDNSIKQNPSYRIKDDYSPWGNPNGNKNLAHSEINDNSFTSYGSIIQHRQNFAWKKMTLTGGVSLDYSPSSYLANYIRVDKSNDGVYTSYTATDSVLTDYATTMLNQAAFLQLEISPVEKLKLNAAVRFDHFKYNYNNHLDASAFSGAPDNVDYFGALAPKLGAVYQFTENEGVYANYSRGFVPPQVGELYRGVKVPTLEPSVFDNKELGGWLMLLDNKLSVDLAYYMLHGLNEIISVQTANGEFVNQNAGKTKHYGVEYGIRYRPNQDVRARVSGTNAKHVFSDYVEKGNDFKDKEMARAPARIINGELTYEPHYVKGLRVGVEWQHVDAYYMDNANTKRYEGFDVFHFRLGYEHKGVEAWCNIMNIGNTLYATQASKSAWGTSYNPGDPRTFNVGLAYKFSVK